MAYYFVIVGNKDCKLFEADLSPGTNKREDYKHLNQFIVHAALDVVEETMWTTSAMYLKVVDRFNDWFISAYVTAGGIKLMLLHDVRNEDNIRNFFVDIHELYIKTLLNSFYEPNNLITSKVFDTKVRALGKKYL